MKYSQRVNDENDLAGIERSPAPDVRPPKVTVVTVFHNRLELVAESINSILNQSFSDFELVIVDDASTDGTADYLRGVSDPRVRLILNENNRGFVANVIAGVASSSSEFIAIHGAGDLSYERRLELQLRYLEEHQNVVAVGCHRDVITTDGDILSTSRPGPELLDRAGLLQGNVFSHGEVMYRRSTYEEAGGYRPFMKYAQDYDLWLRMTGAGKLGVLQEVLYGRRALENGVSFNAAKLIEQTSYSRFAKILIALPAEEQVAMIGKLSGEGIRAVVPEDDPDVLMKLRSRIHVLLSLGSWSEAKKLAFELLPSSWAGSAERMIVRVAIAIGQVADPKGSAARWALAKVRGK